MRPSSIHRLVPSALAAFFAPLALAQPLFDFSGVTSLCEGAIAGINVEEPVPGFELLLLKDGQPVYHRAFGTWTVGRLANADSSTKTISGAVLIALMDERPQAFNLDTRISQYIPQFIGRKSTITIRQAFSHTAGFAGFSGAEGDTTVTLQEAALDIANDFLRYDPGTTFNYGGASMHAAGAVAELAAGEPWNALFARTIAGPLGWTQTRYTLTTPTNPRIGGGCESTADEFSRLMEMLRVGGTHQGVRVLSQAGVNTLLTRQSPVGIPIAGTPLTGVSDYGVGIWLDQRAPDGTLLGALAAGARGFLSWIDLDDGVTGVVATDLTRGSNLEAWQYLVRAEVERAVRNPIPCPADHNQDGFLDFFDYDAFVTDFEAGAPAADFNQDSFLDFFDYDAFVEAYEDGC
jgi:CubicO group peptidase (beta-lactamase class C family)